MTATPAAHNRRRANRINHDLTDVEWRDILLRAGYRCYLCGEFSLDLTVDHMVPLANWGGSNSASNTAPCCSRCNSMKGNRPIWELRSPREIKAIHKQLHTPEPMEATILRRLSDDLLRAFQSGDMRARYALKAILLVAGYAQDEAERKMQEGDRILARHRNSTTSR